MEREDAIDEEVSEWQSAGGVVGVLVLTNGGGE